MTTNLRVILRDFVLYQWVVHLMMLGYSAICVQVVFWFESLVDKATTQHTFFVGAVFGVLPVMVSLYTNAIAKLPSPAQEPRDP